MWLGFYKLRYRHRQHQKAIKNLLQKMGLPVGEVSGNGEKSPPGQVIPEGKRKTEWSSQ